MDKFNVAARYLVTILAASITSWLVSRGALEADMAVAFKESLIAAAAALVTFAPMVWALIKRPSSRAMEVARTVDQEIDARSAVVISKPNARDGIEIPPAK